MRLSLACLLATIPAALAAGPVDEPSRLPEEWLAQRRGKVGAVARGLGQIGRSSDRCRRTHRRTGRDRPSLFGSLRAAQ